MTQKPGLFSSWPDAFCAMGIMALVCVAVWIVMTVVK